MNNKKDIKIVSIFDSSIFNDDNEFEIEYIQNRDKITYKEAEILIKEKKVNITEIDREKIQDEKLNYYQWDFWNIPSYLKDNITNIVWNIYVDYNNAEIIIDNWLETGINGETEIVEFEEYKNDVLYKTYQELFWAQFWNLEETDNFIEVDNLEFNWDWSPIEWSDSNKADYVLKILWRSGNYYSFWEYDMKNKNIK